MSLGTDLGRVFKKMKAEGLVTEMDFMASYRQITSIMRKQHLHGSKDDVYLASIEHCLALSVMRHLKEEPSKTAYGVAQIIASTARPLFNFIETIEPLLDEVLKKRER